MAGTFVVQGEKEWRIEVFNSRRELRKLLIDGLPAEQVEKAAELIGNLEKAGEERGERKVWDGLCNYLASHNIKPVTA